MGEYYVKYYNVCNETRENVIKLSLDGQKQEFFRDYLIMWG